MRAQDLPVLHDVNETDFDRAFDLIKPRAYLSLHNEIKGIYSPCYNHTVIQGEADVSTGLTESELQQAMDFCLAVFAPTDPEMHAAVAERLTEKKELLDLNGPALLSQDVDRILGSGDEDAVHVVKRINARKVTHNQVNHVRQDFVQESFVGLIPSIQRGELGLRPCMG